MWNCSGESIVSLRAGARAPRRPPRRAAVRSRILCAALCGMLCGAGGVLAAEPQLVAQTAAPVADLAWTDDGAAFAVGGADGVSIRDAAAGSVRVALPVGGARALAFAREAGSGGKLFVTLSDGGELSLWNFQEGTALPADIAFAADPAGSGTGTATGAAAGTGQTFDGRSFDGGTSATGTAGTEAGSGAVPAGDTLRYTACAFSRNSDYIAAGTEDGSLRIFFKLRFARQFLMKEAGGQTGKITALTFSPDSRLLASASEDGTALLMSLPSATVVARLPFYAPQADRPLAFAPDGTLAAVLDARSVAFYGTDGMQCGSLIVDGDIEAVSFWTDSGTLAVQTTDGMLSLYAVATGDCIASIPPVSDSLLNSFAFSDDGSSLLQGYENGAVYRLAVADYLFPPAETPTAVGPAVPEKKPQSPQAPVLADAAPIGQTAGQTADVPVVPAAPALMPPAAAPFGPAATAVGPAVPEKEPQSPQAPVLADAAPAVGPGATAIVIPSGAPVTIHVGSPAESDAVPQESAAVFRDAADAGPDTAEAPSVTADSGLKAAAGDTPDRTEKKSFRGDYVSVGRDSLSVYAGGSLLHEPYSAAFDLGAAYRVGSLLPPFYVGAALEGQLGACFDRDKFPHTYTWDGDELAPPKTQAVSLYVPAGVQFSVGDPSFLIFTELHVGIRELMLWQTCGDGMLRSAPHFVPLGGLYTGMLFHGFMLQMGVDYDPIQRFTPGVLIGYSFELPAIGKKGGRN